MSVAIQGEIILSNIKDLQVRERLLRQRDLELHEAVS